MSVRPLPSADKEPTHVAACRGKGTAVDRASAGDAPTWTAPEVHSLESAILHTIVYADLFDYPLTVGEIHRYLLGYAAPLSAVEECLRSDSPPLRQLGTRPPYWFLAGREHLVVLRQQRESFSQRLWSSARRYGHLMASLPFVRMVAVTGSLTMNNVTDPEDDIDYLLVTQEGRLWSARGLAILIVRWARQRRTHLCPNYILAEHHLHLDERNIFTAHELTQLVPLHGLDTYHRLLDSNSWLARYLPNALPNRVARDQMNRADQRLRQAAETVLGGRLGDAVERWERDRKITRLQREAEQRGGTGATFTADLCKGHVDDHAALVRQQYAARLRAHGM